MRTVFEINDRVQVAHNGVTRYGSVFGVEPASGRRNAPPGAERSYLVRLDGDVMPEIVSFFDCDLQPVKPS